MRQMFLRYTLVFFVSALGMMVGAWLARKAFAQNESAVIRGRSLEIVNHEGKRQITIGQSANGTPAMWFYDRDGKARLNLGVYEDNNSFIVFNDQNGQAVQIMRSFGPNSDPVFVLKSGGQDRIIMGVKSAQKEPFLVYYDEKGQQQKVFGSW